MKNTDIIKIVGTGIIAVNPEVDDPITKITIGERVVRFKYDKENNVVLVRENCDKHFEEMLDKEELDNLISCLSSLRRNFNK